MSFSSSCSSSSNSSSSRSQKRNFGEYAREEIEQKKVVEQMRNQLIAAAPTLQQELESLNARQTLAIYHLFKGRNVFLSGFAGTGKTHTTKTAVKFLTSQKVKVALTATTGLAAANLEDTSSSVVAKTLHSFAGIGLAEDDADVLIKKLKESNFVAAAARNRWRDTNVLIIDEISMMSPIFFAKLDKIARAIRGKPDFPFGGLTLFLVGDFHQLEPVMKGSERAEAKAMGTNYCFQTAAWVDTIDVEIMLDQVYRQQDEQFVKLLQEVREGKASQRSIQKLHQRTDMQLRFELDEIAHLHFSGHQRLKGNSAWEMKTAP